MPARVGTMVIFQTSDGKMRKARITVDNGDDTFDLITFPGMDDTTDAAIQTGIYEGEAVSQWSLSPYPIATLTSDFADHVTGRT